MAADMTVESEVGAVARSRPIGTYGEIDLWFSNAGISGPRQPGELQDDAAWKALAPPRDGTRARGPRRSSPSCSPAGAAICSRPRSVVALSTQMDKVAYSVTKHAALALSEWLAATYGPRG